MTQTEILIYFGLFMYISAQQRDRVQQKPIIMYQCHMGPRNLSSVYKKQQCLSHMLIGETKNKLLWIKTKMQINDNMTQDDLLTKFCCKKICDMLFYLLWGSFKITLIHLFIYNNFWKIWNHCNSVYIGYEKKVIYAIKNIARA